MTEPKPFYPEWYHHPADGNDQADQHYVTSAMVKLDQITSAHRTDAMRLLALRYRDDLLRMKEEDNRG